MNYLEKSWIKKSIIFVVFLVLLSPLFVWASEKVNYSEPLENVAEETGVLGEGSNLLGGVFPDYMIPGVELGFESAITGLIGVLSAFILAFIIGKVLSKDE